MKNTEKDFEDISPNEFLDLACELNQIKTDLNSTNSAINRTIYMRIYYAVFLFLREWLKRFMDYESQKGEHTKLPIFIKKHGPFDDKKNREIYLINAKIPQLLQVGDELQVGVYFCK